MMQSFLQILRFVFCLILTIVAGIPIYFIFLLPMLIESILDVKYLNVLLFIYIVFTFFCYVILNLHWLLDLDVEENDVVKIAKPAFTIMIVIGALCTSGLGLLFTLPTILLSIYLIYWNNKKYLNKQINKVKVSEGDLKST